MSEAALALSKQFREMAGAVWEATLAANRKGRLNAFVEFKSRCTSRCWRTRSTSP
jgi:hypothetical protein